MVAPGINDPWHQGPEGGYPGGHHGTTLFRWQTGSMTPAPTDDSSSPQDIMPGTTAVFSMKRAAEVAGISVSTLRRRRDDLVAAGADISPGGWKVPMTALVACGLIAGEGSQVAEKVPRPGSQHSQTHASAADATQLQELTERVRELEREVYDWRRRAEVAEARAEERGRALDALRAANETERLALRMLTAGTSVVAPAQKDGEPQRQARAGHSGPHRSTPMREAQQVAPAEQHEEGQQEAPRRKGFFSRVMGL